MTQEHIEKKLIAAEKEFKHWNLVKETFTRVSKMDITGVDEAKATYICYILSGSVSDAAKAMNDLGFRIGTRKYQSNDISNVIDNTSIDDTEL